MLQPFLFFLIIITVLSCDSDRVEYDFTFPVQNGAMWKYNRTVIASHLDTCLIDTLAIDISTVRLIYYPSFYDFSEVFELKVSFYEVFSPNPNPADTFTTSVWYRFTDDRLNEIAYYSAGCPVVYPKNILSSFNKRNFNLLTGFEMRTPAESDTLFRDRLVLDYPLYKGKQWLSYSDPWRSECRVLGSETITTPSGIYNAIKIEHRNWVFSEPDPSLVFFTYYSSAGLVMREIIFRNIEFTDPDNPDGNGQFFNYIETIHLIEFQL